jgi:hypothetical protein
VGQCPRLRSSSSTGDSERISTRCLLSPAHRENRIAIVFHARLAARGLLNYGGEYGRSSPRPKHKYSWYSLLFRPPPCRSPPPPGMRHPRPAHESRMNFKCRDRRKYEPSWADNVDNVLFAWAQATLPAATAMEISFCRTLSASTYSYK